MYILCKYRILCETFLLFHLYTWHNFLQPPQQFFFSFFLSAFLLFLKSVLVCGSVGAPVQPNWHSLECGLLSFCQHHHCVELSQARHLTAGQKGGVVNTIPPAALFLPSAEVWCTDTRSPKKESSYFLKNAKHRLCFLLNRKQRRSVLVCPCACISMCVCRWEGGGGVAWLEWGRLQTRIDQRDAINKMLRCMTGFPIFCQILSP